MQLHGLCLDEGQTNELPNQEPRCFRYRRQGFLRVPCYKIAPRKGSLR